MTSFFESFIFIYKKEKIKIKATVYENIWKKFVGKMFAFDNKPIAFKFKKEKLIGIHMIFVFIPLLVVWFNDRKKVVKIRIMKPFISFERARGKYVLEIPLKNKIIKNFFLLF